MNPQKCGLAALGLALLLPLPSLRASVTVDSLKWYTSASSTSLTAISDTSVDPSNSVVSYVTSGGGQVVATLPSTTTVTASTPVTLSLSFRDIGAGGLRIGLFNNEGTAASVDGTGLTAQLGDDVGSFLILNQGSFQTEIQNAATGNLFFGTVPSPLISGTQTNYSAISGLGFSTLGSITHTLTMSISLSGTTYTTAYLLDGINLGSTTSTDPALASINEIAFVQRNSPVDLEVGQFSVSPIPEPSPLMLLSCGALGLAAAWSRGRLRRAA